MNKPTNKQMGLIGGHAYSVISVYNFNNIQLFKLRNPWGKHEWKGKWSDSDEETWNSHPQIKKEIHSNKDDGLFIMEFADFCK